MGASRRRQVAVNLILAGGVGVGLFVVERRFDHSGEAVAAHERAPAFSLPRVDHGGGGQVELAEYQGRAVVLNFWASWCSVCRSERPELVKLAGRVGGSMVGIATFDRKDAVEAAEAAEPDAYPVGLDEDGSVAREYGVEGLPETLVLDGDGRIVRRYTGALDAAAVEGIARLVGPRTAPRTGH